MTEKPLIQETKGKPPEQVRAKAPMSARVRKAKQRAREKGAEELAAAREQAQAAIAQYLARPGEKGRHLVEAAAARVEKLEAVATILSAPRQKLAPGHKRHPEDAKARRREAYRINAAKHKAQRIAEAEREVTAARGRLRAAEQLSGPNQLSSYSLEYRLAAAEIAALLAAARGEASAAMKKLERLRGGDAACQGQPRTRVV
jgi:hypothetical protein